MTRYNWLSPTGGWRQVELLHTQYLHSREREAGSSLVRCVFSGDVFWVPSSELVLVRKYEGPQP